MLKEDRVAVNILVADDSMTMRRILELTFQGEDASVTAVENGEAALRKASEMTPDIVFADLSLQGMDGYALATAIKAQSGLERTAVVVMASQKHPYDEEKGKAAGVDDHIIKPFDTANVIERVKQVLGKPRVAPGRGAAAAAPAPTVGRPAAAAPMGSKTIAFGKPPQPANAAQAAQVASAGSQGGPPAVAAGGGGRPAHAAAAAAVAHKPAAAPAAAPVSAAVVSASADLERKISSLGLTAEQAAAVLALSREVVERVVWEIVPDLAEALIKEEIRRLTTG
jgi:CheY-like chemotaxis protein